MQTFDCKNLKKKNYESQIQSQQKIIILSKNDESDLQAEECDESRNKYASKEAHLSEVKKNTFHKMSSREIKERQLKIMQKYQDRRLKLTFKSNSKD